VSIVPQTQLPRRSPHIGTIRLAHAATLAPMEEHTSHPFRLLMKRFGASLVCTERLDADDVARRERRAIRLLYTSPGESPRVGQISGSQPEVMARAARVVEELGFDAVDLNFECPIRRLLERGEGGALLADPGAVARIVAAVVKSVNIPVTLKIRSGPDANTETAVDVGRLAQEAGAAAIEIHARSVAQAYAGGPDWSVVRRVKQTLAIPVLGSGGIRIAADALRFLAESGADGVAIGRGCLGNPWIFAELRARLQGHPAPRPPTEHERGGVLFQLVEAEFRFYGQAVGLRRLARTSCYFAKHRKDFGEFRKKVHAISSLDGFRRLVREFFR
jgi:tRNA-dihydrouridine synthase B